MLHGRIISLKQDSTHLHYRTIRPENVLGSPKLSVKRTNIKDDEDGDDTESLLRHYLNLQPDLAALYEYWSSVDLNFKKRAPRFTGVRYYLKV